MLELYDSWSYELVDPPLIEFLESLLTGTGSALELQTFKLTDQVSGRLSGIRADITPQAARMDTHQLRRETPTRLCYSGPVLRTRLESFTGSRNPLQLGAELYGHSGVASDVEILRLMMETLATTEVRDVYLDLGHVGVFRGRARQAALNSSQEADLLEALQRKAEPEIETLLDDFEVASVYRRMLCEPVGLNGDDVLNRARRALAGAGAEVLSAVDYLQRVTASIRQRLPETPVHFDLTELRGYHFHTGVVFAAFVPGLGQEVARGGRYDDIGRLFGRARPATGFSADFEDFDAALTTWGG